jgi:CheY-like chemotaxis protein
VSTGDALRRLLEESLAEIGARSLSSILEDARREEAPPGDDDPIQMRLFVHHTLAAAVESALGPTAAARVVDHYELTRGLAEEADRPESNTGSVLIVSPNFTLRDRLENLLEVEGFATQSAVDTAEALSLCRATSIALVLLDDDTEAIDHDTAHAELRAYLGSDMPKTVMLVGTQERPPAERTALSKSLDPLAVLETVHALATPAEPSASTPNPALRTATSQPWAGDSPYAPLVYEALELVAAPDLRDRLLEESLSMAGLDAVPADRTLFAQFVNDALHRVIAAKLGEEDADAVILDLQSTSGIHQRAAVMASKHPSSIPPVEAQEIEQEVDDELSGIHRPGLVKSEPPYEPMDAIGTEMVLPEDEPSSGPGRAIKVLLADDDETLLGMLERTLDAAGFEVATATNGRDALSLCLRFEPAVLVADMHMPVLNGRDVAQLVRRMRDDRAPATILLTADPTIPRAIDGVSEVLGKPIRARHLLEAIARAAGSLNEKVV